MESEGVKSVTQAVYEYIVAAGRVVSARELVTALPEKTRSSITFALTRLTREGSLKRLEHGKYRASTIADKTPEVDREDDRYLDELFERIRPQLQFSDLAFLYEIVAAARRLIPETFRSARRRAQPADGRKA
jgi:predicted transcriptional regulator